MKLSNEGLAISLGCTEDSDLLSQSCIKQVSKIIKQTKTHKRVKEKNFYEINPMLREDISKYLKNPYSRKIALFIMDNSKGKTREEIQHEYGVQGLRILDELIKMSIVKKSSPPF